MISAGARQKKFVLLASDIAALFVASVASFIIRYHLPFDFLVPWERIPYAMSVQAYLYIIVLWLIVFRFYGLYNIQLKGLNEFFLVLRAVTAAYVLGLALTFFTRDYLFSRGVSVVFYVLSSLCVFSFRQLIRRTLERIFKAKMLQHTILIAGFNKTAAAVAREIEKEAVYSTVIGFITADRTAAEKHLNKRPFLGTFDEMETICRERAVDEVVIALPREDREDTMRLINACYSLGVSWKIVPDQFLVGLSPVYLETVGAFPLLGLRDSSIVGLNYMLKRALDILGSSILLIIFLPIMVITASVIKLTSPGPVFFRQTRLGYRMRPFMMFKFRSMRPLNATQTHERYAKEWIRGRPFEEKGSKKIFKMTKDSRITPIGRFIRMSSIDELPQLFNVLKGDMSLIGPRPPIPYELKWYRPWHKRRFEVRPGITGLWQVSGRNRLSFKEMVRLDIEYFQNWSVELDIKIMVKTIRAVFFTPGR